VSEEEGLFPIGRLARLSRLSVKALRRYADEGLLEPAWVDPSSGYRYYRREQVRTAAVIALLRSLDVPLAAIREVLAARAPGELEAVLLAEQARVEREVQRRRTAVRSLQRLLDAGDVLPYRVEAVHLAPVRLLGLTRAVDVERMGEEISGLARAVFALATQERWPLDGGLVGLYPVDLADPCPVTLGIPCATAPAGAGEERRLPGGPAFTTIHVGPYDELSLGYTALLTAVHERGHEPRAPIVETYLTDPEQVAPAELVTRLTVPVADP
jgi:DNA-binding transcriptional MerR regulator